MRAATLESVSDMDIRVFLEEELLSLRDEIGKELETREKEKRTPLDLFAQQARRDMYCPICGCHRYCDGGVHEMVEQIMTLLFDADKTEGYYERFHTRRKIKKQVKNR